MCIIAVKCKGADFAPLSAIKCCVDSNPDGFAMAWNQDGSLNTFRTMDPAEAVARYYRLSTTLDPQATALVFHARIATHGSKKLSNCHCWHYGPQDGRTLAFAHNGILHGIANRDDMTDSETFFRDIFIPALQGVGMDYALKVASAIASASHSRLAFVDNNGGVFLTGDYVKEQFQGQRGKIYFSNSSYRPRFQYPLGHGSAMASLSTGRSRPAPKQEAVVKEHRKGSARGDYADIFSKLLSDQSADKLPF